MKKTCVTCKQIQNTDNFYKWKNSCKKCCILLWKPKQTEYSKKYYANHSEDILLKAKERYAQSKNLHLTDK